MWPYIDKRSYVTSSEKNNKDHQRPPKGARRAQKGLKKSQEELYHIVAQLMQIRMNMYYIGSISMNLVCKCNEGPAFSVLDLWKIHQAPRIE